MSRASGTVLDSGGGLGRQRRDTKRFRLRTGLKGSTTREAPLRPLNDRLLGSHLSVPQLRRKLELFGMCAPMIELALSRLKQVE